MAKKDSILLQSWNVNGLRAVLGKGFCQHLESTNPDILCLQEIKLNHEIGSANAVLESASYTAFDSLADKPGYSGVSTLVRQPLLRSLKATRADFGVKQSDHEGRILITTFPDFVLYNCYFPSGTTGDVRQAVKYKFLERVLRHLRSLSSKERQKVVICGDYNICHREIDIHHPEVAEKRMLSGFLPKERAWMDRLVKLGFHDSFRLVHGDQSARYSWWSFRAGSRKKNLGWRIDYFFVGEGLKERVLDADIHPEVQGSDHCPISLSLAR